MQNIGDTVIPGDVREKNPSALSCRPAIPTMRGGGKSYLSIGGVSMSIAALILNQDLFGDYFGKKVVAWT